jgi:hypothetical protein
MSPPLSNDEQELIDSFCIQANQFCTFIDGCEGLDQLNLV